MANPAHPDADGAPGPAPLKGQDRVLRTIFDMVPDGYFVHDRGRVLLANPGGLRMLGASSLEALEGVNLLDLLKPEYRTLVDERMDRMVQERATQPSAPGMLMDPVRMEGRRLDGSPLICRVQGQLVDYDGKPATLTVVYDITEQARHDDELLATQTRALAASRAKSEFLANISHELRTPLNSIIGFAELLQREHLGPLGAEKYREYTADILESGRQLLGLINYVLDWSRVEAGKMQMFEEEIDLIAIARAAAHSLRQIATERGLEICDHLDELPNAPLVSADQRLTRQVILNLLSNALKFTPKGGTISLEIGFTGSGDLCLTVRDTGIGIAPDDLERIFEPFVQAESGRQRRFDGTGLGLALARKMMEMHGGTVELESGLGQGTAARMIYPAGRLIETNAP